MNTEEKKLFEGVLSKTLNLDAEAMSGLYDADGNLTDVTKLLEADADRVAKFKTERQDQYNRGVKEGATKIEKELKKKYSVESDLIGIELVEHILETQTTDLNEKLSKKGAKDEDFEKHPKFAQFKKDHEKQLNEKDKEWETKVDQMKSEWTRKETIAKVAKIAFAELDKDYLLPDNPSRANALKDVMQRELENENYSFLDDGTPVILDKEGKVKEDAHGKTISFKDFSNSIADKYFDKRQAQERGNAGNINKIITTADVFKNKAEFEEASKLAKTPDEQAALYQKLKASNLN